MLLLIIAILILTPVFLLTEWNSISDSKMASLELIQKLGSATPIAANCINQKKQLAQQCSELNNALMESPKNEQFFLVSQKDELIGVDFKHHALIVFTPVTNGDAMQWQCTGKPANVLPKACLSIRQPR